MLIYQHDDALCYKQNPLQLSTTKEDSKKNAKRTELIS